MVVLRSIFVFLLCALAAVVTGKPDPLSDGFINLINSKQNLWEAGRNFPEHTPFSYIKNLMGYLEDPNFANLPMMTHDAELIASLPESFDPRDKWPNCPSLNEIREQGLCASCWAFAAVEVMTDRYCIHSNQKQNFHFSAHDLVSCCSCGSSCEFGGFPSAAWMYWNSTGIVSGGNYNSSEGCRPYGIAPCEHFVRGKFPICDDYFITTPKCVKACESSYNSDYDKDKRRGKHVYQLAPGEDQIKAELFKNGPVETHFHVYDDFTFYRGGVYEHFQGTFSGSHAVKLLGWGVENGAKYWLVANSWNTDWGNKGFFKILRGENHCEIEQQILAGEPLIE